MGAWGTGIFDDDVTADVQGIFEDALAEGFSVPEASRHVFEKCAPYLEDSDDRPLVWLALGALQAGQGVVQRVVQKRVLEIIASDESLDRWAETGEETLDRRKRVLDELGNRLRGMPTSEENYR